MGGGRAGGWPLWGEGGSAACPHLWAPRLRAERTLRFHIPASQALPLPGLELQPPGSKSCQRTLPPLPSVLPRLGPAFPGTRPLSLSLGSSGASLAGRCAQDGQWDVQAPPCPGEEGQAQEELWAWSQDAGEDEAGLEGSLEEVTERVWKGGQDLAR